MIKIEIIIENKTMLDLSFICYVHSVGFYLEPYWLVTYHPDHFQRLFVSLLADILFVKHPSPSRTVIRIWRSCYLIPRGTSNHNRVTYLEREGLVQIAQELWLWPSVPSVLS